MPLWPKRQYVGILRFSFLRVLDVRQHLWVVHARGILRFPLLRVLEARQHLWLVHARRHGGQNSVSVSLSACVTRLEVGRCNTMMAAMAAIT